MTSWYFRVPYCKTTNKNQALPKFCLMQPKTDKKKADRFRQGQFFITNVMFNYGEKISKTKNRNSQTFSIIEDLPTLKAKTKRTKTFSRKPFGNS